MSFGICGFRGYYSAGEKVRGLCGMYLRFRFGKGLIFSAYILLISI